MLKCDSNISQENSTPDRTRSIRMDNFGGHQVSSKNVATRFNEHSTYCTAMIHVRQEKITCEHLDSNQEFSKH